MLGQPVAEQFVRLPEAAELVERHVVEIVLLDAQAAGDVVLDRIEPLPLIRP